MVEPSLSCSKTVQELVSSDVQIPEKYIYKNSEALTDDNLPLADIPILDLDVLESACSSVYELDKLRSALSSSGCFQAINHGISSSLLGEVRRIGKQFFALPPEEKKLYSRPADGIEGYGSDTIISEHQVLDWTDRLYLTVHPQNQRNFEFWPENPTDFRRILQEYAENLKKVAEIVLKSMAKALNLKEDSFLIQYGERPSMIARFNCYPTCRRADSVLGLKPHTDGSAITILLQDEEVEGLQILNDDLWFRVPIIPHALLVNIGDELEIMSNGLFKSPMHRAVVSPYMERVSLAVFCSSEPDMEVGPVEDLITEASPRIYKSVKNYAENYFQYYQLGKRAIDAVRV